MKKFIALLAGALLFVSCTSLSSVGITSSKDGDFNVYTDSITDSVIYRHRYLNDQNIPSWNYFETFQIQFTESLFEVRAEYLNQDWLYINQIALFDDSGNKIIFDLKLTDSDVIIVSVKQSYTYENLDAFLDDSKISEFMEFLNKSGKINIVFIGERGRDSFKVPDKVKEALKASIVKYYEIKK